MRRRVEVPAEVQKQIAEQYAKGRSYNAIMKKFKAFKVTTTEIVKARDEFGLAPRHPLRAERGHAKIPDGMGQAKAEIGKALALMAEQLSALGISSVVIDLDAGTYTIKSMTEASGKLA